MRKNQVCLILWFVLDPKENNTIETMSFKKYIHYMHTYTLIHLYQYLWYTTVLGH